MEIKLVSSQKFTEPLPVQISSSLLLNAGVVSGVQQLQQILVSWQIFSKYYKHQRNQTSFDTLLDFRARKNLRHLHVFNVFLWYYSL